MSINLNGSVRARLKHIVNLLDNSEGTPITYIFIKDVDEQGYKLTFNHDTLIDNDNYIFNSKEDINNYLKQQAIILGVKKITPIIIDVVDNSYLEGAMYLWQV